jgi:hypothetical protein
MRLSLGVVGGGIIEIGVDLVQLCGEANTKFLSWFL